MLFKYFYDSALAHASYLIGCQRTNEALIVDPGRNIDSYLTTAKNEGMQIVGVAETHIHADYLSGARELAQRVGAKLFVSDEGTADWKYQFLGSYAHQLLKDGDTFSVGNIQFTTMHTPGHTPESISFLLTDLGGGADRPMGIFTGDFVFVGAIGRPDLLEKAAGIEGTAESGARQLFHSLEKFKQLPDYLQIWPAHGAGSACGKGLGSIPSSTVGYEKLFNPALGYSDEASFIDYVLSDQPEPPYYFATMKRINKVGPTLLEQLPTLTKLSAETLPNILANKVQLIDTRPSHLFAEGHVVGSWNIPSKMLATWAGWFLRETTPYYLITSAEEVAEAGRVLKEIGLDQLQGWFDLADVAQAGLNTQQYTTQKPADLATAIQANQITVIDVRSEVEWENGHLPHAHHVMLGYLPEKIAPLINGKPIVVQCRSGARSAIAASIVQANGAKTVINMIGGYSEWVKNNYPIERTELAESQ